MAVAYIPQPTPETRPYWDAAARGELLLQQCSSCGQHYFYPRPFCPFCSSDEVEWKRVSGRGVLVSYVINYRPYPAGSADSPQIVALVQLDEGPRLMTNIVGVDPLPEALPLDAVVSVDFMERGDQALPVFRLVEESS